MKLNLSDLLFLVWTSCIALWWIGSSPDSAPQQAALAGQALVLICIPYCALSVLQRSWAAQERKRQETASKPVAGAAKST
jgi:hypothetical protein